MVNAKKTTRSGPLHACNSPLHGRNARLHEIRDALRKRHRPLRVVRGVLHG